MGGPPIHHSRDLINWELAGYALQNPDYYVDAVNLVDVQSNGGIHAPSIRHHDGAFHVIATNLLLECQGVEEVRRLLCPAEFRNAV